MQLSDDVLDHLEAHIPEMARAAVTQAYYAALAAGRSVFVSEGGVLYEVFPDGTRRVVKDEAESPR